MCLNKFNYCINEVVMVNIEHLLTGERSETSAVHHCQIAVAGYRLPGILKATTGDNKSPSCTTRKDSINLCDRGLFPPLLTYFRIGGWGQRGTFYGKAADCVLNLPSHINLFVHHSFLCQRDHKSNQCCKNKVESTN